MTKPPLVRSPLFVFRLVVGLSLSVVGVGLLAVFENALLGLRTDIATLQGSFPPWLPVALEIVFGTAILGAILATNIGLLAGRRIRWWALVNAAALTAMLLSSLAGALTTTETLAVALRGAGQEMSLGNAGLASLIAVLTLTSPWIGRRLRPWIIGVMAGAITLSFIGGAIAVISLPLDIGVGMVAGSLVALVLKTRDRTPSSDELSAVLAETGIGAAQIAPASVDARGSVPWFVTMADGTRVFVKTLGSDQRAADLLFRFYRWIRLRKAGDRRPFASLARAVEHEALLSLAARSRGIQTPTLVAIAEIGTDGILLAYERIEGRTLDDLPTAEIPPQLLRDVWMLVAELGRAGIAHRDLRLANVLVADDGKPWLIDFGFAELAAPRELLSRDVAELIGSTAAVIGAEAAVAAAVEVLGPEPVVDALPWIQPLAVTTATRTQLGKSKDFEELRTVVAEALGVDTVPRQRLERISPRTLFLLASVGVATYVLVPQLTEASGFLDEVSQADLGWVLVACMASGLTYVGAAIGIVAAVPERLALRPVIAAQVASSFANRVTPAKVGGMAANVRFLQRRSIPASTAVSAVGLNTLAGLIVHVSLLVVIGVAVGRSSGAQIPLPSTDIAAIVVGVLILLSGLFMALPAGRKILSKNLVPAVKTAWATVAAIAKAPARLAALFSGSAIVTLSYTVAMIASLRAMGGSLPLAAAALVYLGGAAVATAAPTPGGVGATEAALIAGYTAVGVDATVAFAAVLLFRLVTFWLPILPGWVALVTLQRRGDL